MNVFFFRVLLENGKHRTGLTRLSVSRDASARMWLEKNYGGTVLNLYRLPKWLTEVQRSVSDLVSPAIRPKELSGMLRDLGIMSSSGVPVLDAIRAVSEDVDTGAGNNVARVGMRLLEELDAGASISDAFNRQPDVFPETVRNLVLLGDETGSMDRMLLEAADHIERVAAMKADTKQALIYPAFVFAAIFGAAGFWIYYVIPNLLGLFTQMNAKLPWLTVVVLDVAAWLTIHFPMVCAGLVVSILGLWVGWRYSRIMRRTAYYLMHKLPVTRGIVVPSGLAFFSEYLSILIRAGLDMVSSLSILERAMRDEYYYDRIVAMRQVLEHGDRISVAMRQVGGFPPMMRRMISVGEDTGSLDKQLAYLAKEYSTRLQRVISTLSEIIKPLVVVFAGGMFAILIIALLLPIYDLVRQSMSPGGM
jgi:type II secretory pathway component PulF